MRPMIGVRHQGLDRPSVAAQLVGDDNARSAKLSGQTLQEPLRRLCVLARLDENVQNVAMGVDRAPEPVLHATYRNHHLVKMPFVRCARPVPPDACCEMSAKAVHPQPHSLPADGDATLCEKVLDIRRAQRETVVCPDGVGDQLAPKTKALQARHGSMIGHIRSQSTQAPSSTWQCRWRGRCLGRGASD